MQAMGCSSQRLYRYRPRITTTAKGNTEKEWERDSRAIDVALYPKGGVRTQMELGVQEDIKWFSIVQGSLFQMGDRLGTATEQLYEVVNLWTFSTTQQMEVREIARSNR